MTAAPVATAPEALKTLTKDDLVKYLASGCKPREKWRCVGGPIWLLSQQIDSLVQSLRGHRRARMDMSPLMNHLDQQLLQGHVMASPVSVFCASQESDVAQSSLSVAERASGWHEWCSDICL